MLIVHWAGEASDVIIALAKFSDRVMAQHFHPTSSLPFSKVYISRDYGQSFADISSHIRGNYTDAVIDKYYNSDILNSHVSLSSALFTFSFTRSMPADQFINFKTKTKTENK